MTHLRPAGDPRGHQPWPPVTDLIETPDIRCWARSGEFSLVKGPASTLIESQSHWGSGYVPTSAQLGGGHGMRGAPYNNQGIQKKLSVLLSRGVTFVLSMFQAPQYSVFFFFFLHILCHFFPIPVPVVSAAISAAWSSYGASGSTPPQWVIHTQTGLSQFSIFSPDKWDNSGPSWPWIIVFFYVCLGFYGSLYFPQQQTPSNLWSPRWPQRDSLTTVSRKIAVFGRIPFSPTSARVMIEHPPLQPPSWLLGSSFLLGSALYFGGGEDSPFNFSPPLLPF